MVIEPGHGSTWLNNAKITRRWVSGEAWDRTFSGNPYYPDDYRGEWVDVCVPRSCLLKVEKEKA